MIYWQLLCVYLKIGLFGFGGGYAMLSLIQHEVVDKHEWLTRQEFTDVVAISQMTPGPIGINSATTGLRPMTVGLIAAAGLLLVNHENFIDWKSVVIFAGAFFLTWKYKMHPILVICLAGAAGLFIYW